jgi:hypothetical protein
MNARIDLRLPPALLAATLLAACSTSGAPNAPLTDPIAAVQPAQNASGTSAAATAGAEAGTMADDGTGVIPDAAATRPFAVTAFGGFRGERYVRHKNGAAFEYSEDVTIVFNHPIVASSFSYKVTPATPTSVYFWNKQSRAPAITVRKTPGTTYTLTVAAGVEDTSGNTLAQPLTYTFTTAATPVIPAPVKSTAGQPYRYGVLEHPFSPSLSGSTGAQQIAAIAAAGARFVRIDYCGSQSEAVQGTFDFTTEDAIMDQLAADGITELPIIDQYCAPSWSNGGGDTSATWGAPQDYAAFAGAVAAHVAAKYPQITRIELFNEPNLGSWWNAPAPYADQTGVAAAAYMQPAYAAIKAAAPSVSVVGPALADGGVPFVDPRTFLTNMYGAGCRAGTCWDILSVHNYRWMNPVYASRPDMPDSYPNRFDIYKDLQAIAVQNHDRKPHVMLTEWADSTSATDPNGFDPAVQAQYLAIAFNLMLKDPTVDGIVYTNIYNSGTDFWGLTSLETAGFSPLPGYAVYHTFATT